MKTKYYKYTDKTKGWVSITKVEKKNHILLSSNKR